MNNKTTGMIGEDYACEYLKKIGYKILERNIHFSRQCELDIIAVDKANTLVAVEVKTRKSDVCGTPLEAITPRKYTNIKNGLYMYLKEHAEYKKIRIDAISVLLNEKPQIQHIKNIG